MTFRGTLCVMRISIDAVPRYQNRYHSVDIELCLPRGDTPSYARRLVNPLDNLRALDSREAMKAAAQRRCEESRPDDLMLSGALR